MCGRGSKWKVVDVRWLGFVMVKGLLPTPANRVDLAEFERRCGLSATLSDCNYAAL